eukprot:917576-Rhodomonas_salina.3
MSGTDVAYAAAIRAAWRKSEELCRLMVSVGGAGLLPFLAACAPFMVAVLPCTVYGAYASISGDGAAVYGGRARAQADSPRQEELPACRSGGGACSSAPESNALERSPGTNLCGVSAFVFDSAVYGPMPVLRAARC